MNETAATRMRMGSDGNEAAVVGRGQLGATNELSDDDDEVCLSSLCHIARNNILFLLLYCI
jgi:hypothetical protein